MTDLDMAQLRLCTLLEQKLPYEQLSFNALLEQNKEIIAALKELSETLKANANAQQLAFEWRLKKTFPVYLERSEYPRIKEG